MTLRQAPVAVQGTPTPPRAAPIPDEIVQPWKLPPQTPYLFTHANVVDTAAGTVLRDVDVKIAAGLVQSVAAAAHRLPAAQRADSTVVVDATGKFLCPGLIDAHVHLASVPGDRDLAAATNLEPAVALLRQPFVCAQVLARGFTTVRDCGGATLALQEALAADVFPGPRLFISGRALSQTGGHGDRRGPHDHRDVCHLNAAGGLSVVCDGPAACAIAAREQLRTGADFLKVMTGGGVASPADPLSGTQFSADELRAVCDVARGAGVPVTAHAYTPAAVRHAVEAGVGGVEHGNLIDADTARLMADRGVWLTPTLVAYEAMASESYAGFLPPESRRKNREVLERGLRSLRVAADAGVRMCYGSDLLGFLSREQSREFAIRARVLSSRQVLEAATVNPAAMLGQGGFLGQIRAGFAADLLVLDRNPLEDVAILADPERHVLAVVKDGRVQVSRWSKLPRDVRRGPAWIE